MKIKEKLKKQSKLIISLIIGIVLTSGIVYAETSIQSELVSYTNSKTSATTVKGALDELINTSISRINTLTQEKTTLINEKNTLQARVNELEKYEPKLLSSQVQVGDYVDYYAGAWTSSTAKPTSQGEFGGYTVGQNRANSVSCYESSAPSLKGWRVLSINKNTNTVTIVHAGQPECYYHGTDQLSSVTNLNNRATSVYLNTFYATSAHNMNYNEAYVITGNGYNTTNNLRTIGAYYWLASPSSGNTLWDVGSGGFIYNDYNYLCGVRPVVVLKSNIKTTGKTIDAVGQDAWSLVAP